MPTKSGAEWQPLFPRISRGRPHPNLSPGGEGTFEIVSSVYWRHNCKGWRSKCPRFIRLQVDGAIIEYTLRRRRRRKKTVEISVSPRLGRSVRSVEDAEPGNPVDSPQAQQLDSAKARQPAGHGPAPGSRLRPKGSLPGKGNSPSRWRNQASEKPPPAWKAKICCWSRLRGLDESDRHEALLAALKAWYREQARQLLADSVARWLPVMGRTEMPRVLVREQRTRWGSCSADGTLRFSWRLALVEPGLIDSVAVHELAHLDVMNHSQDFWDVVLRAMPDARERRRRLNHAGRFLPCNPPLQEGVRQIPSHPVHPCK